MTSAIPVVRLLDLDLLAAMAQHPQLAARQAALGELSNACRTPLDLFQFLSKLDGKWNYSRRRAVARWYNEKPAAWLAHFMRVHPEGSGYTHADVLRLAHPVPPDYSHSFLYAKALGKRPTILGAEPALDQMT